MKEIDWKLPQLGIIKSNTFTGAHGWMRYSLRRSGDDMIAEVWPHPYEIKKTDPDLVNSKTFPFSEQGEQQAAEWFKEMITAFPKEKRTSIFATLPEGFTLPWQAENKRLREEKEAAAKAAQEEPETEQA